ncbi:MAG: inositol monophosphatase [Dehalococcoidia bacterium]|nr:inositol monophosphatase [Dehalococcoidia bacterium]
MDRLPLSRSGRTALEVASQAADEAGSLLLEHVYEEREIKYKEGRANIVTDVDVLVENRIIALLQSEYPDYNVLSEESAAITNDSAYTWVIDPLDGTNNYVHGIPFYSVAIALTNSYEVLLGLTYDPWRKELFVAQKGAGAWLNGQPISVSERTSMEGSFIGCDMGYDAEAGAAILEGFRNSWPQMCGIRIMGSAVLGLAYVACGRLDLYIHPYLYPWDVASGILLVKEAGGKVTDWESEPASIYGRQILAGNETVHHQFMNLMKAEFQLGLKWA